MISPSSHTAKAREHLYQTHFLLPLSNTSDCCQRNKFPNGLPCSSGPGTVAIPLLNTSPLTITPLNLHLMQGQNEYLPLPVGKLITSLQGIYNLLQCSPVVLHSDTLPSFQAAFHHLVTFYTPWSLRVSDTQDWAMSQTMGQWGQTVRPGKTVSTGPSVHHFQRFLRLFLQAFLSQYS